MGFGAVVSGRQIFFNFSMQFPWGSRLGYTHFVVKQGLGGDSIFPGRKRPLCMFLVLNTVRHVYGFFWRDIAIVFCKMANMGAFIFANQLLFFLALIFPVCVVKRRMLPFGHLFFPVFCLVLYVPPVLFWGSPFCV